MIHSNKPISTHQPKINVGVSVGQMSKRGLKGLLLLLAATTPLARCEGHQQGLRQSGLSPQAQTNDAAEVSLRLLEEQAPNQTEFKQIQEDLNQIKGNLRGVRDTLNSVKKDTSDTDGWIFPIYMFSFLSFLYGMLNISKSTTTLENNVQRLENQVSALTREVRQLRNGTTNQPTNPTSNNANNNYGSIS